MSGTFQRGCRHARLGGAAERPSVGCDVGLRCPAESGAATGSPGRRQVERSVRLRPGGLEQVVARSFSEGVKAAYLKHFKKSWKDGRHVKLRLRTYTAYSIGCAVAWAVLLAVVAAGKGRHDMRNVLLVFYGWVIAWVSNTVARAVYPPPRARRPRTQHLEG